MTVSRGSILEEASFHESEISIVTSNPVISIFDAYPVDVAIRVIIAMYTILRGPQTGGMRIQNIRRILTRKRLALILPLLVSVLMSDSSGRALAKIGLPQYHSNRARNILSFVTLLLFIAGRTSEVRPDLALCGSVPIEAEPGVDRQFSGEFISRFLVVDALANLCFIIFPMFDVEAKVRSLVKRFAPRFLNARESCSGCGSETIVLPQLSGPCEDVYCYYCIRSEVLPFNCYRCHKMVTGFSPRDFNFPS
jgi:hypothetical protein